MSLKHLEFVLKRDNADYGLCLFERPGPASLRLVVSRTGGQVAAIATNIGHLPVQLDWVENLADHHARLAEAAYREASVDRFMPELLAYMRGLPADCRSPFLDSDDRDERRYAEDEVKRALVKAMQVEDDFRAAVYLERMISYLSSDVGIIDVISDIRHGLKKGYEPEMWLAEEAKRMEKEIVRNSQLVARQVNVLHSAVDGDASIARMKT